MINKTDYIELGLACADVCKALERGMSGKKLDDLSQSVCEAIVQLTTWDKPVYSLDIFLMVFLIAGMWRGSKGWSSNRTGGMQFLDLSMRRAIRKQSPLGS